MPSSTKTEKLKLNKFTGTDKPKMDDVNYDNLQLEALVGGHFADMVGHITSGERGRLFENKIAIKTYMGVGTRETITVEFPFVPTIGVVFAEHNPLVYFDINDRNIVNFTTGIFSSVGCSMGLALNGKVLTLTNVFIPNDYYVPRFDLNTLKFVCVAVR